MVFGVWGEKFLDNELKNELPIWVRYKAINKSIFIKNKGWLNGYCSPVGIFGTENTV